MYPETKTCKHFDPAAKMKLHDGKLAAKLTPFSKPPYFVRRVCVLVPMTV
jgi:hypothetical protein